MSTGYMRWGHWAAVSTVNSDAAADEAEAAEAKDMLATPEEDLQSAGVGTPEWEWLGRGGDQAGHACDQ